MCVLCKCVRNEHTVIRHEVNGSALGLDSIQTENYLLVVAGAQLRSDAPERRIR